MFKTIGSRETRKIAVTAGSKPSKWGESEHCKM
jgi:hypothetical protein